MNEKLNLEEEIEKSDKILSKIFFGLVFLGFGIVYGPSIYYDIKSHLGDKTAIERSDHYYKELFKVYGNASRYGPLRHILEKEKNN